MPLPKFFSDITIILTLSLLTACNPSSAQSTAQKSSDNKTFAATASQQPGHLRLKNDLDRPQDGYCLDIMGSGQYVRFDLPMTAHNCKPGLYADEAVTIMPNGELFFPAYNVCTTVAGLNGRALDGAAVLARPCGEDTPFMRAEALQKFTLHQDGKIELKDSGLCLSAGNESDRTFEPTHRWRSLFVTRCATTKPELSQWYFTIPKP
ncbi:MAG: hypothetical protein Q4G42_00520 [Neisseria sp.]|nr:hypothetical protein [Neisseria sp.]